MGWVPGPGPEPLFGWETTGTLSTTNDTDERKSNAARATLEGYICSAWSRYIRNRTGPAQSVLFLDEDADMHPHPHHRPTELQMGPKPANEPPAPGQNDGELHRSTLRPPATMSVLAHVQRMTCLRVPRKHSGVLAASALRRRTQSEHAQTLLITDAVLLNPTFSVSIRLKSPLKRALRRLWFA